LEHVEELIADLEKAGIHPTPVDGADEQGGCDEDEGWTDEDEDAEMIG
jgi:hypothetical protein